MAFRDSAHSQRAPLLHASKRSSARSLPAVKPLSMWALVSLIFYSVSGGPFGTEDAVAAGGPFWALLGFLVFPLIWCVPEALITAELTSVFPNNTGYVSWVTAAFGPYWGFQEGFWSWLSGVTDNAIYPHLFLEYLKIAFPVLGDGPPATAFLIFFSCVMAYINYRGLHVVGWLAVSLMWFVLAPFVVLCLMGLPQVETRNFYMERSGGVNWMKWLNVLFWNLNYWDSVSTLSGEVPNPQKTMPRAMCIALVIVCLAYIIPLLIGVGVMGSDSTHGLHEYDNWSAGFFEVVAYKVGGTPLAFWILLAAAVSNVGQFEAEMSADAYQIQGMAELGWLPACFSSVSPYGTPTKGIGLSLGVICSLTALNFLNIVELLNVVYCLAELLEFAAFLWLRYKHDDLDRPYKIPLSLLGLIIWLSPAIVFVLIILFLPFYNGRTDIVCFLLGAVAVGNLLYFFLKLARKYEWLEFLDVPPSSLREVLVQQSPAYGPSVPPNPLQRGSSQRDLLLEESEESMEGDSPDPEQGREEAGDPPKEHFH